MIIVRIVVPSFSRKTFGVSLLIKKLAQKRKVTSEQKYSIIPLRPLKLLHILTCIYTVNTKNYFEKQIVAFNKF